MSGCSVRFAECASLAQPAPVPKAAARHEFVYLIMSYGSLDQTAQLIRTVRQSSPDPAILLQHDAKSALQSADELEGLKGVHVVQPRVLVTWGDGTFLDATLARLRYIVRHFEFSWVTALSGQDYPLRPLASIQNDLGIGEFDADIRTCPATADHYPYRYRMQDRHMPRRPAGIGSRPGRAVPRLTGYASSTTSNRSCKCKVACAPPPIAYAHTSPPIRFRTHFRALMPWIGSCSPVLHQFGK